jgi:hypothetical protein
MGRCRGCEGGCRDCGRRGYEVERFSRPEYRPEYIPERRLRDGVVREYIEFIIPNLEELGDRARVRIRIQAARFLDNLVVIEVPAFQGRVIEGAGELNFRGCFNRRYLPGREITQIVQLLVNNNRSLGAFRAGLEKGPRLAKAPDIPAWERGGYRGYEGRYNRGYEGGYDRNYDYGEGGCPNSYDEFPAGTVLRTKAFTMSWLIIRCRP